MKIDINPPRCGNLAPHDSHMHLGRDVRAMCWGVPFPPEQRLDRALEQLRRSLEREFTEALGQRVRASERQAVASAHRLAVQQRLDAVVEAARDAAFSPIEAAVREQVAQEIEALANQWDPPDEDWPEGGMAAAAGADGLRTAARIARGQEVVSPRYGRRR
jgi:hypothetical protein